MAYRRKEENYLVGPPLEGIQLDMPPTMINDAASTHCMNLSMIGQALTQRAGVVPLGDNLPLDGPIFGFRQFADLDGNVHTMACTDGTIYSLNSITNEWEVLDDTYTTVGEWGQYINTAVFTGQLVMASINIPLLLWDGGVTVSEIDAQDSVRGSFVKNFGNRLVVFDTLEDSVHRTRQRVRWTAIGTYDDFDNGDFVDLVDSPGGIVAVENLGNELVIYKENSIVIMTYLGSPTTFGFETRVAHLGGVAPRGVVALNDRHYFLGADNVYLYQGGRTITPVGDGLRDEMPALIQGNAVERVVSGMFGDEVWFVAPMESIEPDTVYVYNWRKGVWFKYNINASVLDRYVTSESVTIGDLEGSIGDLAGLIRDFGGTATTPFLVVGKSDGYIGLINSSIATDHGEHFTLEWQSKDFVLSELYQARYIRYRGIDFELSGTEVEVSYSNDEGITWTPLKTLELSSRYKWYQTYFDSVDYKIRFRLRSTDGEVFSLRAFNLKFLEVSER